MKTLVKFMDNEDLVVSRHTALVSGSLLKPFSNVFRGSLFSSFGAGGGWFVENEDKDPGQVYW